MAVTQGKPFIKGTAATPGTPITIAFYKAADNSTPHITGYVSPVINSGAITHNGNAETLMQDGEVVGVALDGESLSATFECIPAGSTTLAEARLSAALPTLGSTAVVANADVIAVGSFADAINSGSGSRWIYEGGGSINLSGDGKATLSIPMKRYPGIAGGAAVVS